MAVDDDGAAVDMALSGGLAFGAEALRWGCGLPSVTVGAALVGRGDAALGSRWCDLQQGHVALGSGRALGVAVWRCGGVTLGWLSVAVWFATALVGVLLSFWALGGDMVLTLSGGLLAMMLSRRRQGPW